MTELCNWMTPNISQFIRPPGRVAIYWNMMYSRQSETETEHLECIFVYLTVRMGLVDLELWLCVSHGSN